MNASKDCTSPEQQCDFAKAFAQFRHLLDPADVTALQPLGARHRLHHLGRRLVVGLPASALGNASLQEAVAELVQSMSELSGESSCRRTDAVGQHRSLQSVCESRLKPEVAEQICDKVYETLVADASTAIVRGTAGADRGWHGHSPRANAPMLVKAFPPASNQNGLRLPGPLCHMVVAHELSSGLCDSSGDRPWAWPAGSG